MKKVESKKLYTWDERDALADEWKKTAVWKQFFKQKIQELVGIPIAALALWKIPTWLGYGIVKLLNIDLVNNTWFCNGVSYDQIKVWGLGLVIFVIIAAFIGVNYTIAKDRVNDESYRKFSLYGQNDEEKKRPIKD